jgi:2'-5' RNA ligase
MARLRTFVAIDMSRDVKRQAQSLIRELSACTTAVRWVLPDQLHLTLKFLGDVDQTQLYDVCRAVDRAVAGRSAFDVVCRTCGAFPHPDRPRTLWLGLEDPTGQLAALQQHMEMEFAALKFPREMRASHPHVTIGRVDQRQRRLEELRHALRQYAQYEGGSVAVTECVVYTSELSPNGPTYTAVGRSIFSARGA